jgi:CRP-like cAMP-binding protein
MPFLEGLDPQARELLLTIARPMTFHAGELLVRHGTSARGAYLLKSGTAQASVVLPGGERLRLAQFDAGDLFGEAALLERAMASASVHAATRVEGWLIEREGFRALVAQRTPPALALQHAVTLLLCAKLRELNGRVLACASVEDRPATRAPHGDPLDGVPRVAGVAFDHRRFLPLLPLLVEFDAEEIEETVAGAPLIELARGAPLFYAGQPARACFLVVRGALEIWAVSGARERRLVVSGPGSLTGFISLIAGGEHTASAFAREASVLIEMERTKFEALYHGPYATSAKLHRAMLRALVAGLKRSNTQLSRLIAAARLRGAAGERDALEAAHASQIVAAEPSPET